MEDNKLVTPATTNTATAPEVKEEAKAATTTEAAQATKTFTEDELNKLLQSERSKAKGEILKALDIKSVDDGKQNLTKSEQLELNLKTALTKLEQLEEENAIVKLGVAAEFKEEALTLAKAKVNSTTNLQVALQNVVAKFPGFLANGSVKELPKVGADQGATPAPASDTQKIIETLNKKYRTNIKL
jgi:hypothetical protein